MSPPILLFLILLFLPFSKSFISAPTCPSASFRFSFSLSLAHPPPTSPPPPSSSTSPAFTKAQASLTAFANRYNNLHNTTYCSDLSVTSSVLNGLARNKVTLGAPLCPCRFYKDREGEAKDGYWNCPCVPMRERRECHCMLFLTEGSGFEGERDTIGVEEVREFGGE